MDLEVFPDGRLRWQGRDYRCALGRSGVTAEKREGDGATPAGRWQLRALLYRADRIAAAPATRGLIARPLAPDDSWCDDPADANYNRQVKRPYGASHEEMWRDDGLYDVVVVLGHNDRPPVPGLGSAIFLHVAAPDYASTEGCVALALKDLLEVLADCGPESWMLIHPAVRPGD
jgi:L,D-peptidoglycan transpeptidase YkuD (ErfK/YbiS/YcfS/YnhG family)